MQQDSKYIKPNYIKKTYNYDETIDSIQNSNKEQYSRSELPLNKFNTQAVNKMVQNIKSTQKRFTQIKAPCQLNCQCKSCIIQNRFKRKAYPQNMDSLLWVGLLVVNPNTANYQMVKSCLTYRQFSNISINSNLNKIKYFIDKQLCIPLIKITHSQNEQKSQTIFFVNRKDNFVLYVKIVLAFLTMNHRFSLQYKTSQSFQGYLYKKYSIHGNWEKKLIRVEKNKLKDQKNQTLQIKSSCFWTSFQIVNFQIPHMVIKVWDGIWKIQYGLPIDKLSEWLTCFLSLIQTS